MRTLYQRCPHLGCKPNFCPRNYWFECPCHGSRYDRLGIKVAGARRAGAAEHGPLRRHRRRRWRAHRRHLADHAWSAAGRPRPARAHPADVARRVHRVIGLRRRPDDRDRPPRSLMTDQPGGQNRPEERLPIQRPPTEVSPADRFTAPPATHEVSLTPERAAGIVRQSSNARWVGFLGDAGRRRVRARLLLLRARRARPRGHEPARGGGRRSST